MEEVIGKRDPRLKTRQDNEMTLSKSLITAIAAAAAIASIPASAGSAEKTVQKKEIIVAGYDLSEIADAKTVLRKIKRAAQQVCSLPGEAPTLRARMEQQRCQTAAIEAAVKDLNAPVVASIHESTTSQ